VGYRPSAKGVRTRLSELDISRTRLTVGMVFQSFNLFPHLNVLDNVTLAPIEIKGVPRNEARAFAKELLARVGLSGKEAQFPSRLSGGQQQRVAIARALALQPKVMLFDEVTSALDPELVGEVLGVMRQLALDGMTMIIVTHEMYFARDVADRIMFLEQGKIAEEGNPKSLLENPQSESLKVFLRRFTKEYFL
jgi:ABC-type polar amino acid transport system ATPase subunit